MKAISQRQSLVSNLLRAYTALLRAWLGVALTYRAQAMFWLLSAVFPLVMLVVWLAVENEVGPVNGWTAADFISYYVAAAVVYRLTVSWAVWQWDEDIRMGGLSVKLLKPIDPAHSLISEHISWLIFDLVTIVPLVVLLAWLLPVMSYPIGPAMWLAAVVAIIGGSVLNMLMAFSFGMIAFWSTQSGNVFGLVSGVGQFLAGYIAPLALFPEAFRNVALLLPFRSTVGLPVEIMQGRLAWPEIWFGLAVTATWIVIFFTIYRLLWRLGLRRYEAVGA
ncbi:MAG: ABC-2 family transporter protein [Chloroflexaceae bacterium]|jgi:ABC-2 type transport system permease protein|nr:ABC-2 family transporter protein [Chloroflexaceae bacterium]